MRIAEICSRDIACIDQEASVRQAATEMRHRHTGCLVVVDGRDADRVPRGIVTDRDIVVEVVAPGVDTNALAVRDVMSRPLATCREDDKLLEAIELMRLRGVRRLPVVGARGELVGIVSADDIMSALGACLRDLWQVGSRGVAREIENRP